MQPLFVQKASGPKNSGKIIVKFKSTSSDAHRHLLFLQLGRLLLSLLLRLNFLLSTGHAGIYWIYVNFFVSRKSGGNRSFYLQFMRLVYRNNDVDDFSDELEDLAINSALKIYNLYLEFFLMLILFCGLSTRMRILQGWRRAEVRRNRVRMSTKETELTRKLRITHNTG